MGDPPPGGREYCKLNAATKEETQQFIKTNKIEGEKRYNQIINILYNLDGVDECYLKYLQEEFKKGLIYTDHVIESFREIIISHMDKQDLDKSNVIKLCNECCYYYNSAYMARIMNHKYD